MSFNIVLFGETGVGKSSIVNLIAGRDIARISPDAVRSAMNSERYGPFKLVERSIRIWDTAGLNEPEIGADEYIPAITGAFRLIQELSEKGGVDLLLFCIRANRITTTVQSNYRLFYEILCRKKVPIALAITHAEREEPMEGWWDRNGETLKTRYEINPAAHVCLTGLPRHPKSNESRQKITDMLAGHAGENLTMPSEGWLKQFLRAFGLFAPLKDKAKRNDIVKVLITRCGLNSEMAEELATELGG